MYRNIGDRPISQSTAPQGTEPAKRTTGMRNLQLWLEYAVLRTIIAIVHLFPLDLAGRISAFAWEKLAPIVAKKRHDRALDNLKIAFPEKTDAERQEIARLHWRNLGRVMVETMLLDRVLAQPERIEIVNPHVFARYQGKMGPLVGVTLHMGNWELAVWPLTHFGMTPAAVYRSVNNPYVDAYLRKQRATLYPGGLFGRGRVEGDHGEARKTARQITAYVRDGGRLGLVCDLYDRTGIAVPFFGKPASTQAIPAIIARRTGGRIWMGRCIRVGERSRFRIQFRELRIPRTDNPSDDVRETMAAMQAQFEQWVRENPEQWMWSNRRWS